jgi:undecaprenyl-diphosphatase
MLEFFENIDVAFFYFINSTIACSYFDKFFPFITNLNNWVLVYVIMFGWLFLKGGKKGWITASALAVAVFVTDHYIVDFLKEEIARIRPCHVLDYVRLLVPCGGGKSFPSAHAANNFAAAAVLAHSYIRYKWVFYVIAFLIAFSRVYVGVHYPSDIIAGGLIGFGIGFLVIYLLDKLRDLKNIIRKRPKID